MNGMSPLFSSNQNYPQEQSFGVSGSKKDLFDKVSKLLLKNPSIKEECNFKSSENLTLSNQSSQNELSDIAQSSLQSFASKLEAPISKMTTDVDKKGRTTYTSSSNCLVPDLISTSSSIEEKVTSKGSISQSSIIRMPDEPIDRKKAMVSLASEVYNYFSAKSLRSLTEEEAVSAYYHFSEIVGTEVRDKNEVYKLLRLVDSDKNRLISREEFIRMTSNIIA